MTYTNTKKIEAVCFTGHREISRKFAYKIPAALKSVMEDLIARGARRFRAGGAMGLDTIAALCVLELQEKYPDITLELILPCRNQTRGWSEASIRVYNHILQQASLVEYVSEKYTPYCMHERNRRLVNESQALIAFCTRSTGGSAYTYGYALKKGLEVINIYDMVK